MLGLGETEEELHEALYDLRGAGVNLLTLGQYLQPNKKLLPVERYVTPEEFDEFKRWAEEDFGFAYCASGPMVRSSYKAAEHFVMSQLLPSEALPSHDTSSPDSAPKPDGFAGRMVV